jgi:hypothetical protein
MRITSPLPGQRLALVEFDYPHEYEDRVPPIMDAPLDQATVITSLVDGQDLHKPILDVDLPVSVRKGEAQYEGLYGLTLTTPMLTGHALALADTLELAGLGVRGVSRNADAVTVTFSARAFVIPSSTPGHGHLYVDRAMHWSMYQKLLNELVDQNVLEPGYVGASEARGWTCVRLPWVRK